MCIGHLSFAMHVAIFPLAIVNVSMCIDICPFAMHFTIFPLSIVGATRMQGNINLLLLTEAETKKTNDTRVRHHHDEALIRESGTIMPTKGRAPTNYNVDSAKIMFHFLLRNSKEGLHSISSFVFQVVTRCEYPQ